MKKIFTLFAGLCIAATAAAQAPLYCTGDFAASNWAPSTPVEFTYADGHYTLEIAAVSQIKVSTTKGTWDEFNAGAITASDLENNVAKAYTAGDANILMPWKGDYTITVDMTAKTILVSTTTPAPTGYTPIYIRGDMNGWGTSDAWAMQTTDGVTYSINNVTIAASAAWKIADGNWGKINYGANAPIPTSGSVKLVYNAGNCQFSADFSGNLSFNVKTCELTMASSNGDVEKDCLIYWDNREAGWETVYAYVTDVNGDPLDDYPGNEMNATNVEGIFSYVSLAGYNRVVFNDGSEDNKSAEYVVRDNYIYSLTNDGTAYVAPKDYTGWYFNVPGEYNSWGDNGVAFAADGTATINLDGLDGQFKFKIWNGTSDVWLSTGSTLPLNEWVSIPGNNDANMTLPEEFRNTPVRITYNEPEQKVMVETYVVDYTQWYVNFVGPFNEWSSEEGVQCDAEGIASRVIEAVGPEGFKIKVWDGTSDRWYSTGEEIPTGQWITLSGNAEALMTLPEDAQQIPVIMTFNAATKELHVASAPEGIEAINADNAAPVYFNLQGQRVDNPANGLYIRVAAGRTSKVVIR